MEVTQHTPADVRGRIMPIDDEETMIAGLRAGAEAVERGELDAEDFAGIWSQYLRELFRRASALLRTPHGEGEADEQASCTCEWMHPTLGTINPHWPAVLDPECIVHREAARHSDDRSESDDE